MFLTSEHQMADKQMTSVEWQYINHINIIRQVCVLICFAVILPTNCSFESTLRFVFTSQKLDNTYNSCKREVILIPFLLRLQPTHVCGWKGGWCLCFSVETQAADFNWSLSSEEEPIGELSGCCVLLKDKLQTPWHTVWGLLCHLTKLFISKWSSYSYSILGGMLSSDVFSSF